MAQTGFIVRERPNIRLSFSRSPLRRTTSRRLHSLKPKDFGAGSSVPSSDASRGPRRKGGARMIRTPPFRCAAVAPIYREAAKGPFA